MDVRNHPSLEKLRLRNSQTKVSLDNKPDADIHEGDKQNNIFEAAQKLLDEGCSVIPIKSGTKAPHGEWEAYQTKQADRKELETWFKENNHQLGLVTGCISGGYFILDFDGENWNDYCEEFLVKFPEFQDSRIVSSGSGKAHIHGKCPKMPASITKGIKKYSGGEGQVELRCNRHQTVVPPSVHPSGTKYSYSQDNPPVVVNLDRFNEIVAWIREGQSTSDPKQEVFFKNPEGWQEEIIEEGVGQGKRNNSLTRLAGRLIAKKLSRTEILSIMLTANANFTPPLDESEVGGILDSMLKTDERNHPKKDIPEGKKLHRVKGCDVHYEPRKSIVEGFPLYKEFLYQLAADSGEFKTILTLHICKCLVSLEDLFGKYKVLERVPVLYFDEENPKGVMEERLKGYGLQNPAFPFYLYHFSGVQVDDDEWVEEVIREVEEVKTMEDVGYVFVVLDSLVDFHSQEENSSKQMKQVMKQIRRIANAGSTVWSQHHVAKESKVSRGSGAIKASLDMEFKLTVNDKKEITLEATKNRIAPFEPIVVVPKFDSSGWKIEYKQTKDQDIWDKISEILTDEPIAVSGIMQELVKRKIPINETTVRRVLFEQREGGLIRAEKIKVDLTLADGRIQKRKIDHFWKL